MTIGEAHPFLGRPINIRSLNLTPVATKVRPPGVIQHDDEDVGFGGVGSLNHQGTKDAKEDLMDSFHADRGDAIALNVDGSSTVSCVSIRNPRQQNPHYPGDPF